MRVGADHWRRNAETVGSGGRQGFVREHAAEDTRTRLSDSTRLAQVDIVRQLSPLGTAKSAELQTVNKRHPRLHPCEIAQLFRASLSILDCGLRSMSGTSRFNRW